MQKISVFDLRHHEGKILARDVYYNGQLLFQNNSIIDKAFITRVSELANSIFYVFIHSNPGDESNIDDDITNIIGTEIVKIIDNQKELIFKQYCNEDSDLIETITDFFLKDILRERYFKNYLENMLIINNGLFAHSIRVTVIALILAIKANLNQELIYATAIGSLLHEVGRCKLFIEFPILANSSHEYNLEEFYLTQIYPTLGFNEIYNNKLVPLVSKRIVLLQNVWEVFSKSYNEEMKTFMSHPVYYENKELTTENKDICVNILQAANYVDKFYIKFRQHCTFTGKNIAKKYNDFYIRNSQHIFSKEVYNIMIKQFLFFTENEKVILNDGRTAIVQELTCNIVKPIVTINNETVNLAECSENLYIDSLANEEEVTTIDKKCNK